MSSKVKQYIWAAAIMAIAMVFIMQFRPGSQMQEMGGGTAGPTCAVENDGRCIVSQSDYVTAFRLIAAARFDDDQQRDQMRALVLEGLIQRWLLLQDAKRLGIRVSEDDVTRQLRKGMALVSLPADLDGPPDPLAEKAGMTLKWLGLEQPPNGPARAIPVNDPKTGKFDYERYKRWVQNASQKTIQDFKEFASDEELAARMRAIVKARVRVSEQEAYVDFASQSSKIAVEYVELSRSFYQRHADASADAVAKWTEKNAKEVDDAFAEKKDEFAPECRKARHILVRIDDSASDKEAAKKKAREKLDAAKKRIDGGDDFATVAREVSEDAQSAPRGGELGCFAAGKLAKPNTAKPVDDAAFGLAKGKVSAVVESSFGLHLVKVEDVLKGEAAEKEGKSQIAREKYLRAEGDRLAADAAKQILDTVKGGKTLEAALSDHLASLAVKKDEKGKDKKDAKQPVPDDPDRPKIATSKEFTSAGPPFPGVEDGGGAARMLFALDKPGAVAPDVIKLYDGFAVAALKEKKGVDAKEWEEKRATLLATLRQKRQQDALVAYLHQLRQKHAKSITYITSAEEGDQKKAKDKKKPDKAPAPVPSGS